MTVIDPKTILSFVLPGSAMALIMGTMAKRPLGEVGALYNKLQNQLCTQLNVEPGGPIAMDPNQEVALAVSLDEINYVQELLQASILPVTSVMEGIKRQGDAQVHAMLNPPAPAEPAAAAPATETPAEGAPAAAAEGTAPQAEAPAAVEPAATA